jgi:hypothetical protein
MRTSRPPKLQRASGMEPDTDNPSPSRWRPVVGRRAGRPAGEIRPVSALNDAVIHRALASEVRAVRSASGGIQSEA